MGQGRQGGRGQGGILRGTVCTHTVCPPPSALRRVPRTGAAQVLLGYMARFNYEKPENWAGYRALTDK